MSDWMANPPKSASQQWELAQQAKTRTDAPPAPDIKTKTERDHLVAQRETPRPERHYTPTGMQPVPDPAAQQREARIKEINAALQKAKIGFEKDFDRSR